MYKKCREAGVPTNRKGFKEIQFDTIQEIEERCATTLAEELGRLEDDKVEFEDYIIQNH